MTRKIFRRDFLLASNIALLSSLWAGKSFLANFDTVIPLTLPAAKMRDRAIAIRNDFIQNHFNPKTAYPLLTIFQSTSMLPNPDPGHVLGNKLLTRGGGKLQFVGTTLTNDAAETLRAPFSILVCDHQIGISVTFPKKIEIVTTVSNQNLTLLFSSPIYITLNTPSFECNGQSINLIDQQILETLTVSDSAAVLITRSSVTPTRKFRLTLDFTKDGFAPLKRVGAHVQDVVKRIGKSFLGLVFIGLLSLGFGCGPVNPTSTNNGPTCPIVQTTSSCAPIPPGWVVTGHNYDGACSGGGGLSDNHFFYSKWDDPALVVTTTCQVIQIEACVDSNPGLPPHGWTIQGYRTDAAACQQPFNPSQNNIAILQKLP